MELMRTKKDFALLALKQETELCISLDSQTKAKIKIISMYSWIHSGSVAHVCLFPAWSPNYKSKQVENPSSQATMIILTK